MDRKSSLRAYVRTKEDQAEANLEAKGEEELELLADPLVLANTGILLTTNKRGDGKVVFSLRELPLHSEWRTSAGHTVARVSRRDVLICDVTGQPHTIDVPSETLLTILYLPDAVLQTIWLHLVPSITNTCIPQDIGRCRLVCRHWARMIEKMVVYERTRGIRFVIPSHPVQRVRSIYDSDDEDYELEAEHDNDDEETLLDGIAGRHTTIARLWVLSTSRPKPAPAKGILKRPADDGSAPVKSKTTKKSVRFTGLGDESEAEEAEKERRARESVRRKLTEGSELSKRFLASFFGWSKHHHRKRSSLDDADLFGEEDDMDNEDEDADDQESADSDDMGEDSASTVINSAEEAWYRTNVFENQTRNLNRLKELEMRLEEMVRSKGRLGCKLPRSTATSISGEEGDQMDSGEGVVEESRVAMVSADLQSPTRVEVDGWAQSPVYMSPPEALPDDAREEANAGEDDEEGKPKRRRRDSFSGLLSSMSGAGKKLLSR